MDHAVLTPVQIPYTDINMMPLYGVALVLILWAFSTMKRYMLYVRRAIRFIGRCFAGAYYDVVGIAARRLRRKH